MLWRHVIITTHCAWLPGDKRGWRSRRHRIHSSGDYKNPPPADEHDGLLRYSHARSGAPVTIPPGLRAAIGKCIVNYLTGESYRVLVVSVARTHAHILVELPESVSQVRRIIGVCKARASGAVRKHIPGRVWGGGGKYLWIKDRQHLLDALQYIRDKQGQGAWAWTLPKHR